MIHADETAERALLGAALLDPRIVPSTRLAERDFSSLLRGVLWEAIGQAHRDGLTPDPATVAAYVPAGMASEAARMLVEVVGDGSPGNAEVYASSVRDAAERRRVVSVLAGLQQRIADPNRPVEDTLAAAETELFATTALDAAAETLWTLDEFIDRPMPDLAWTVPGLLAAGERLVLTGVEGYGKSVLMRQLAVTIGAGVHPFSLRTIPRKKVLFVDCENPERIMMSKLDEIRRVVRARGQNAPSTWIKRYPGGLDLTQPRDRLELHHVLSLTRPDLLLIGPVYKLYVGGAGAREEDLARQVTDTLDKLREEFGFSLILEHHSPHAASGMDRRSVRPIGSSLWLRWPEFGFGLRPHEGTALTDRDAEVTPWRGSRDERPWPRHLVAGPLGGLPWIDPASLAHERNPAA